jgi:hypothetical protein
VVKTDDGAWLCCVTTGNGHEGAPGQHVSTKRSTDQGKTWSTPVPVEAPGDVENSYAVMLKIPSGRIYIYYNHNTDNVREVKRHDGGEPIKRVDSCGHFVFKYSDDHGKSWSAKRYDIPFRLFQCDLDNVYGGKLCFFWNVGKPFIHGGIAYVPLIKVGQMGDGFFQQSEGVLLKSDNLLSETDPEKNCWETLPDGDVGLRTPPGGGPISEEQSYVVLSDGSFYVVYRSIDGYPVESYSRDGGHTWSQPQYKRYADGRMMKHPRAANFVWKCENGKYIYWFHNHGGRFVREMWGEPSINNGLLSINGCTPHSPYDDRNPVWLCGGIEADSPDGKILKWSQPEIVLYTDDPFVRMSYPDLIEDDGKYFITETQKNTARVHEIPTDFIEKIWAGVENKEFPRCEPILSSAGGTINAPVLPEFFTRNLHSPDYCGMATNAGIGLELDLTVDKLEVLPLIDGQRQDGRGLALNITKTGCLELLMNDGWMEQRMTSEPCLKTGKNHVVINIDGGPRVVSFVVNGQFCDGGEYRQFGWQRFSPYFRHVNWSEKWTVSNVDQLKVYNRILMTAEAKSTTSIPACDSPA